MIPSAERQIQLEQWTDGIQNKCEHVATMLKQIEGGAPWPRSAIHARVAFLETGGAAVGEVVSYRPLTIIAPLYRCWAMMRLRTME